MALAQFGGRDGDAVLLVVSAKGSGAFKTSLSTTVNTQTGFIVEDPTQLPDEPFGPDFPGESRRKMHGEDGDVFNMIVQKEGIQSPHQYLQGPVKLLIFQGMLRLFPLNKQPIDAPVGLYSPFPSTVDFGPNEPLFPGVTLMWTPSPLFPVAKKDPGGYVSPIVPPGQSGIEYVLERGAFTGILPWQGLNQVYPNSGWAQGIDRKLLEEDTELGATWNLIRIRPGRTTPTFEIDANTHFFVLSGRAIITPAGGVPTEIKNPGCQQPCSGNIYAFVPPRFAIQLSNPAVYKGPIAK